MNNPLAVGWDLDSTLCSTMHRRHLVPEIKAGRATWDDYSELCVNDVPVASAVALARLLHAHGHLQVAISGRSERARERTLCWLDQHGVPMDAVLLRPEGDDIDVKLFKVQQINELREQGLEFCLFIEDWAPVAEFITEKTGIPVLGVNPFDEGSVLVTRDQLAVAMEEEWDSCYVGPRELAVNVFSRLGGAF